MSYVFTLILDYSGRFTCHMAMEKRTLKTSQAEADRGAGLGHVADVPGKHGEFIWNSVKFVRNIWEILGNYDVLREFICEAI